jgi:hypothetical protein
MPKMAQRSNCNQGFGPGALNDVDETVDNDEQFVDPTEALHVRRAGTKSAPSHRFPTLHKTALESVEHHGPDGFAFGLRQ